MKKSIIPVLALLAASGLSAQTTTYLLNTFATGSGSTTNVGSATQSAGPTDVGATDINGAVTGANTQWYQYAATSTSLPAGGGLNLTDANGTTLTYFSDTPVDISGTAGNSITLSFSMVTSGTIGNSTFKAGLFNSAGNLMEVTNPAWNTFTAFTRPTINSTGNISNGASASFQPTAVAPYLNWTGVYGAFNPLGTTASSTTLYVKPVPNETGTSTAFMTSSSGYGSAQGTPGAGVQFSAGTTYYYSLSMTWNSATSETLTEAIRTGSQTGTVINTSSYTANLNTLGGTAFDTIAFNPNNSAGGAAGNPGWTLNNITVAADIAAVPEPSTCALFAGLASLMGVGLIRARSRRKS